jgi:hypothetical protein
MFAQAPLGHLIIVSRTSPEAQVFDPAPDVDKVKGNLSQGLRACRITAAVARPMVLEYQGIRHFLSEN